MQGENVQVQKSASKCHYCQERPPKLKRSKNGFRSCVECFSYHFEEEVHQTIMEEKLFKTGDKILLAVSGGKDSTVLVHVMTTLRERHAYPVTLELLAIDEGIKGYRDDSLTTVRHNSEFYKLPLRVLSYKDLFGFTMDEVVKLTNIKCSCSFCGVFRRRALDCGLVGGAGDRLYTGHNADDMAETVLMNLLRGDSFRLASCTAAQSGSEGELIRCKPFKYAYEKEIVLYAYHKKLEYFSTECTYAKDAFRGSLKELVKRMSSTRPGVIEELIRNAATLELKDITAVPNKTTCKVCGFVSSNPQCNVCKYRGQLVSLAEGSAKWTKLGEY